eukprot:CAMPEP_0172917190 /NCGR_PEP_ID=MMETSP1075-20121228/197845_1 /TAXON_ID=2916 /ORGANISM="Ceratium fusus, Strain PA161109" /LENGTH=77 /DNA_ID=CAMNT_0013776619 /DNA_START=17 /DNA_END=246 /DNA_ORIENTATION=-
MTGRPLLTGSFRNIPPRVLKKNDANLVRSITTRSAHLLQLSRKLWPVLTNVAMKPSDKLAIMSRAIQQTPLMGETWA